MNFIKKLFKKKPYKFLGRGGMTYSNGDTDFYIESENFIGKGYDVAIFYKDIKTISSEKKLSDLEKKEIAIAVKELLEGDGINSNICPI